MENKNSNDKHIKFTKRESDVIWYLCMGLSNQEIADKLSVKLRTVKTHLEHMYSKLSIHNRTQLIHYAYTNELIDLLHFRNLFRTKSKLDDKPIIPPPTTDDDEE